MTDIPVSSRSYNLQPTVGGQTVGGGGGGGIGASGYANIAGGVASQYLANRGGQGLNEFQQNRQNNIGILNDFEAAIARDKDFDPLRAFRAARSGQARAYNQTAPGRAVGAGYGATPGEFTAAAPTGRSGTQFEADILAALRDPATYSLRTDENGNTIFDPSALAPDLAFAAGKPTAGKYSVGEGGEIRRFGTEDPTGEGFDSAARGAISGASTGASIGTQISPGYGTAIGAGVGAVGGGVAGYFRGRGQNREASANRQANIGVLNDRSAALALDRAFNPARPYLAGLSGLASSAGVKAPGTNVSEEFGGTGAAVGYQPNGRTELDAQLINAFENPETYGFTRDKAGNFIFDPQAVNPLNLNFLASGNARTGSYSRSGGETRYFGQPPSDSEAAGRNRRPSSSAPRDRREDEDER